MLIKSLPVSPSPAGCPSAPPRVAPGTICHLVELWSTAVQGVHLLGPSSGQRLPWLLPPLPPLEISKGFQEIGTWIKSRSASFGKENKGIGFPLLECPQMVRIFQSQQVNSWRLRRQSAVGEGGGVSWSSFVEFVGIRNTLRC